MFSINRPFIISTASAFSPLDLRASVERVRDQPEQSIVSAIAAIEAGVSAAKSGRGTARWLEVTRLLPKDGAINNLVRAALYQEGRVLPYVLEAGALSNAEYALLKLEEILDQRATGELCREREELVAFIPARSLPFPLPDLIGTRASPGSTGKV